MRITSLYIKEFRNLQDFSIDFASEGTNTEGTPVTFNSHAIIGQNGSGKSNLLEAIIIIFRDLDLKNKPPFAYRLSYEIRKNHVEVAADVNETPKIMVKIGRASCRERGCLYV